MQKYEFIRDLKRTQKEKPQKYETSVMLTINYGLHIIESCTDCLRKRHRH